MHLSIRTLRAYECYEECDAPANGIIAGCLQSNYLARALLFAIMQRHYNKVPRMLLRSFVDDVRQSHAGDPHTITQQCVELGTSLASDLVGLGCIVSPKTKIMATTLKVRRDIREKLRMRGIKGPSH